MSGPGTEVERGGRPVRLFPFALSAEALALAWARQERAPHGAAVLVDQEVSPRGFHGVIWTVPPVQTLACAVVVRPSLPPEQADLLWLATALAGATAGEEVSGVPLGTLWPDAVVEVASGSVVGRIKTEVQLGPGQVRSAVCTVRLDLGALGLEPDRRDEVFDNVVAVLAELCGGDVADAAPPGYDRRCVLVGQRVKIALLPKGETRGVVKRVDRLGRLELTSATGMIEHVSIDMVRSLDVV